MKKVIVHVTKEPGKPNCACYIDEKFDGCGIAGYGPTVAAALADMETARKEFVAMGRKIPELEYRLQYDIWAFFDKFPLNITPIAKDLGINPSLMRQYVAGIRRPSARRIDTIEAGIRRLGREMAAVTLERP